MNEVLEICKKMVWKCKAFENLKSCAPITLGYKQTNKLEKVEEHSMKLSMQHVHDELISLAVRWVTKRSKEEKMRTFWVQGKLTWWALDVCVWNVGKKFGVLVDDVFTPGKFLLVVWAPRFSRANGSCTSHQNHNIIHSI